MKLINILKARNYFVFLVLLIVSVHIALNSEFNKHPDEYAHVDAFNFFQGKLWSPDYNEDGLEYSPYGWSRVYTPEVIYKIFGNLLPVVRDSSYKKYITLRLFNVSLFFILFLYVSLRSSLFFHRHSIASFLLCLPQLTYLFSYSNSDAFGIFISTIIIIETLRIISRPFLQVQLRHLIGYSLLLSLAILTKANYYFAVLFCLILILFWVIREKIYHLFKVNDVFKILICCLLILTITMPYLVLYPISQYDVGEKEYAMREERACINFRPSNPNYGGLKLYTKGSSFTDLFTERSFLQRTLGSFWGYYGYMTINHSSGFYYFIYGLFFVLFLINLKMFLIGFYNFNFYKRLLFPLSAIISLLLFISVALNAYLNDFQPQGRYLYGTFIPIFIFLAGFIESRDKVFFVSAQIIVSLLMGLSCYSLITKLVL